MSRTTDPRLTVDSVNALPAHEFAVRFGAVYEHAPWVAERAGASRPFASLSALHAAMAAAVAAASEQEKLELLRAHPDLAGRAALAGDVTAASRTEQGAAGLASLTPDEMTRFQANNDAYRQRFGFPFILAVKHWTKAHILAAYEPRLANSAAAEMATALAEVDKIALSRLLDLVVPAPTGRLTVHVLDTAQGCPAAGMEIGLSRLEPDGQPVLLKRFRTNHDGRLDGPALRPEEMAPGRYELAFAAGAYFLAHGLRLSAPAFLDVVPVRFAIANPEETYHVPLLLSPWAYSTYRGS